MGAAHSQWLTFLRILVSSSPVYIPLSPLIPLMQTVQGEVDHSVFFHMLLGSNMEFVVPNSSLNTSLYLSNSDFNLV